MVRTFEDFIKVDVYTGDSDPVYWAVAKARHEWGINWATRFSVAMLAYYHTGTAVQVADYDQGDFWDVLIERFTNAPRGSERRHMRGDVGITAIWKMRKLNPDPNRWFHSFPQTYNGVKAVCESQLSQFGPYFQLKVCDYMDRCLTMPIQSWAGLESNLPSEPYKSLKDICPGIPTHKAFAWLVKRAQDAEVLAAPIFDRLVGPAEVETSLCGYHTTKYKGNWFGEDIRDKRAALVGYGDRAHEFMNMFPPVPSKDLFKLELE